MSTPNNPLPYERAAEGAEDKYRLTLDTTFYWHRPPRWVARLIGHSGFVCGDGWLRLIVEGDGSALLALTVFAGFHFAVSVAPSFARALAGACLHDFLYKHAAQIAAHYGCTIRKVLHLADHWFLAQMRASGFALKRTYFAAVRLLGYPFNRLSALLTPNS